MQPVERRNVAAPAAPVPSGGDAVNGGRPARSLAGKLFRRTLPVVVLVLLLIAFPDIVLFLPALMQ